MFHISLNTHFYIDILPSFTHAKWFLNDFELALIPEKVSLK